jgi:4-amino-4-deoxy-L-arabinose transferase-like glycosyltransferase
MLSTRSVASHCATRFQPFGLARRLSLVSADSRILCLAVAATVGLGLLCLPRAELPIHDETYYVGPAVRLAETGQLLLDGEIWASVVTLIAWGALALKLFGGGLVTLRCAVLLTSALCVVAFDALLRQLDLDRPTRALALAVLVVQPLFVSRSVSFMTEMPFLLFLLAALAAGMAGLRQ